MWTWIKNNPYLTAFIAIVFIATVIFLIWFFTKDDKAKMKVNPSTGKLLFVGDSLTEFSNSFADQLQKQYPKLTVKKIAMGSTKTDWMLTQLRANLSSGNKYDAVTIWGGVNDIYATNSIKEAKANLDEMYTIAQKSGAKVIALTVIPTATYTRATPEKIKLTNDLNSWIKSNKKVDVVVDVNALVNDGKDGTKEEYLQSDTLHLTSSAQALIEKNFAEKNIQQNQ